MPKAKKESIGKAKDKVREMVKERKDRGRTQRSRTQQNGSDHRRREVGREGRAQLRKAEAEQKLALAKEIVAKASEETCRCAANLAMLEAAIAAPSAMDDSGEDNPWVELLEPCL